MSKWWAVLAVLLVAASDARAGESVNYQGNPAHDGHVTGETFAPPLGVKWRAPMPRGTITHPVVAGGRVIVGVSSAGDREQAPFARVVALAAGDGRELWSRDIPQSHLGLALAYEAGRVFVLAEDATLHALSAESGATLWTRTFEIQSVSNAPTASGGSVYVAGDGVLYAMAADSGAVRWSKTVGLVDYASPTVGGGRVFTGGAFETRAYSTDNGGHAWSHDRGNWYDSHTPVLAGGRLLVRGEPQHGGTIHDAIRGDVAGTFASWTPPAVADGIALLSSDHRHLRAVDLASGTELWSAGNPDHGISAPLIVNGRAYVGAGQLGFAAFDLRSGEVVWRCSPAGGGMVGGEGIVQVGLGAGGGLLVAPVPGAVLAFSADASGGCAPPPGQPEPFRPPAPAPAAGAGGGSGGGLPSGTAQGAQAPGSVHYGGGVSPTPRRNGLAVSAVRTGDAITVRVSGGLNCRNTFIPAATSRARGTVSGDVVTARGESRVLRGLRLRVSLDARVVGEEIQGTLRTRPIRRRGGPRGCGGEYRAAVRLRTQVAPAGAPVAAPRNARLRGLSTQTAGGVRMPVMVSTGASGRVIALWAAQARCARGSLPLVNLTPATRVAADGTFARPERYRLRFRGGITEHYRVRFAGRFRADGVEGTLQARIRVTDRRGRTLARCSTGLHRFGAA